MAAMCVCECRTIAVLTGSSQR